MTDQEMIKVFQNPGKEYRGTPFWSWNTKLDPRDLEWQIKQFKKMGMGGFYIHTRVGLDTEYLGEEYMECVKKCAEIAKKEELYCCLYDEDRWPSGYGGGRVTARKEFRGRNLLITPYRKGTKVYSERNSDSMASPSPQGNGTFLAAYEIALYPDGTLKSYRRCEEDEAAKEGHRIWYVYLEIAHDSPWFNGQSYVDTLNPKAIRCFLDSTHKKYEKAVGELFGKTIPSIFTDEPQFGKKRYLGSADSKEEVMLPYTDDFAESYRKKYGEEFLDFLPELLWELPERKYSRHRYAYHDHVTERFTEAYSDQVGSWCEKHHLALVGHMMEEPTLQSQTQALGEVMRCLRGFTLPGIDMLCDAREYMTAKQAQSVSHQYGRRGVVSELYGVTNWDFDFRRHKLQGDWQAALGITNRVHHLNWMSMGGEAKRDYPAAIGFQSPWYEEYQQIETHFSRLNVALTRGIPFVKIGVIHPVESMWLLFGPNEQTGMARQELDRQFFNVTEWLLFGMQDFDYISESLLPAQWKNGKVGAMEYEVIIVPCCLTLRKTTLSILREMKSAGKEIIFVGKLASYVDAYLSNEVKKFAETCTQIECKKIDLIEVLEKYRVIDMRFQGEKHLKKPNHKKNWNGERTEKYLYQMRRDGDNKWLFLANGREMADSDLVLPDDVKVVLDGVWDLEKWDTDTGEVSEIQTEIKKGKTIFYERFYEQDSLLIRMLPKQQRRIEIDCRQEEKTNWKKKDLYKVPVELIREEPNVLVLDQPEYDFDGRGYQGTEEILRLDNLLRKQLNLPLRRAALAQPWTKKDDGKITPIRLRYQIVCKDDLGQIEFAMEHLDAAEVYLDGKRIETRNKAGYFVDPCIQKIVFPTMTRGDHIIELVIYFSEKINLESCYLLGDFLAYVNGSRTVLCAYPNHKQENGQEIILQAAWGSLTEQGFPFYGGNVIYRMEMDLDPGEYQLEISKFRSPLLAVFVDGKDVGRIYRSPYRISFLIVESGRHVLEIKSFGNRINTFGAIHNCDEQEIYFDPNAWRTIDESWAYEYQLKKTGILKAPVLWKKECVKNESD